MRIVGGEFRGRALATPKSQAIRPTTDRTRESLFNIIAHAYPEALDDTNMLDLFAGTGAIGLEAISRGVRMAVFVENSVEGRGLLWSNIDTLGLHGRTRIMRRDATKIGQPVQLQPFDFLFADPPYGKGLGDQALDAVDRGGWLKPGALVIVEERAGVTLQLSTVFQPLETRDFGDTEMHFFRYQQRAGI
ncbi:16S rRNA (guanine(966)-N(2))-methyltransferase RsmD [Martelella sp. HB161492]|uniref:16S rRNA (guanine(966)-N(2))-methyltransferase RsmD n=1 Tax=Martelella sp. HB161492 TaxID=2720726 RepID=UPI00159216E9|nr:16S rRNA (guanine(966)-N(2))-methyltransferase RsmD [Martelella sp. HB161492]